MHRLFPFLLFLFFLPDETISAPAGGGSGCKSQRDGVVVPYPFGFSGDCPITLGFDQTTSMPLLPRSAAPWYPILSFNSTSSTFIVSVAASCNRSVPEARASLSGAGYGVSSRTGIFLRGGCSAAPPANSSGSSSCTVPSDVMTTLLRTAQCGGNGTASSWTCVASAPPDPSSAAAARGEGQFMRWDRVEAAGCEDALTSAVFACTPQGFPAVEFGVAELGWWLDGACAGATNGTTGGGGGGGRCAANATCHDVVAPGGEPGHRCACRDGMLGDGFADGEGCYFGAPQAGECSLNDCGSS